MDEQPTNRRQFLQRGLKGLVGIAALSQVSPGYEAPDPEPAISTLPKASLMLVGGGYPPVSLDELRATPSLSAEVMDPQGIYRAMLAQCPRKPPVVAFITSASEKYADETARQHELIFKRLGAKTTYSIETHNADAYNHNNALLEQLRQADIVFITGGDQTRLAQLMRGTKASEILKERYASDPDFVLAGTSAGSMIMAQHMIDGNPKIKTDPTPLNTGFGFIPAVIETHMNVRSREKRLLSALAQTHGHIAIGVDNATALIVKDGKAKVKGDGRVLIGTYEHQPLPLETSHRIDLGTLDGCLPYKQKHMEVFSYRTGDQLELGQACAMPAAANQKQLVNSRF